jgi:hypothetical protein
MTLHKVKCDYCSKQADLKYNGEHWLAPKGWLQMYDDDLAHTVDAHACPDCKPKSTKPKKAALNKGASND